MTKEEKIKFLQDLLNRQDTLVGEQKRLVDDFAIAYKTQEQQRQHLENFKQDVAKESERLQTEFTRVQGVLGYLEEKIFALEADVNKVEDVVPLLSIDEI
jgi:hypothetical protein